MIKWPWLKMIPSTLPKFIPNMSALWITPFSLTPVSNRNELLVPSSDLKIVIKAENPCSATGGGSMNFSFCINEGLA